MPYIWYNEGVAGIVYHEQWRVTKHAQREGNAARVRRRIASAHELNAFDRYPSMVGCPPKSVALYDLANKHVHPLRAVRVVGRKIDFVAKDHEPFSGLLRCEHKAIACILYSQCCSNVLRMSSGDVADEKLRDARIKSGIDFKTLVKDIVLPEPGDRIVSQVDARRARPAALQCASRYRPY